MREYDITVGCENIFAELMDLERQRRRARRSTASQIIEHLRSRYEALWGELTGLEEFRADEMWRIEQRVERLNDLGFDVDELDIVTDLGGDTIRIQPKVVDLGHHARELQALTGMSVEENQARRLLNDLASFTAHFDLGREDRHLVASRWMHADLRADHGDDPARRDRQAGAGRGLPRDPRAPVVPLGAGRPARSTSTRPPATTSTASSPPKPDEAITGRGVIGRRQSPDQPASRRCAAAPSWRPIGRPSA